MEELKIDNGQFKEKSVDKCKVKIYDN